MFFLLIQPIKRNVNEHYRVLANIFHILLCLSFTTSLKQNDHSSFSQSFFLTLTNISYKNNSPIETILLKYDAEPQLWDWCLYSLFACIYPPPNQHEFQTNSVKEDFTWTSPKSCTTNLLRRTNYNRTCLVLFINVYKIFGILG